MRCKCGSIMAKRDEGKIAPDLIAGVPDSGLAHAIGYSNESGINYGRPFIKYTPTWARSFMPTSQAQRSLVAKRKLVPVPSLIQDKKLLLIDDSIVRGTQLQETTEFLYNSGAKEVHVRPACPPLVYGCKYLNFSRSKSEMDSADEIDEVHDALLHGIIPFKFGFVGGFLSCGRGGACPSRNLRKLKIAKDFW